MFGNGTGCFTLTGSFAIDTIVFGPNGYVQQLDATYEQHCDGIEPALRGDVHITNPPPPPLLALGVHIARSGTVSGPAGDATVTGTATCNMAAPVDLFGTLTEVVNQVVLKSAFSAHVDCTPGQSVPWTATVLPLGDAQFQKGRAEVDMQARSFDFYYQQPITAQNAATVRLFTA
jgi:hypothetical protein